MPNQVRDKVEAIVMRAAQISGLPPDFSPSTPLERLGIDSVILLEIIVTLEEEFGIAIADESLNDLLLSSIDGLVTLVEINLSSEANQ